MFKDNERIPSRYTCDGENVNPPLKFFNVPENAKSLALIMEDLDSPSKIWVHWTIWNISPEKTQMESDGLSNTEEGLNDFGECGYGGPCPHFGTHRYQFKLYALDTVLNLPSGSTKDEFETAATRHIIDKAFLTGTYSR